MLKYCVLLYGFKGTYLSGVILCHSGVPGGVAAFSEAVFIAPVIEVQVVEKTGSCGGGFIPAHTAAYDKAVVGYVYAVL